jgi:CHAT domain-containing protein/Tfp pilus assembly protein PilF
MRKLPQYIAGLAIAIVVGMPTTAAAQRESGAALYAKVTELYKAGKYTEATPLAQRLVIIAERESGPDHSNLGSALMMLGSLYDEQARYVEAEPLYKRALTIYEGSYGADHPVVALALANLANLYVRESRYNDAERLYQRSLAIREKALGPDHIDVGQALGSLASLYDDEARYDEAEPLYKRSLAILEKAHGRDHSDVAIALNNLASHYRNRGRYADAERLYKQALAIREKVLGPDDPNRDAPLYNLAGIYRFQARYSDAEPLYKQALAIREKVLGPNHPAVAQSLNSLANFYADEGRDDDAEPLYRRSLAIYEKALGPNHPDIAGPLGNLANLCERQTHYDDAEKLYKRALAIYEKAVDPDHPYVASQLANLAHLYQTQHRYADAEPLFKRAVTIFKNALGPEHPDVARSLNNLANLYKDQAVYSDAEPLFKEALAISEKAFGPDHPEVARSMNDLASLYLDQARYADALPFEQRLIAAGKALTSTALPLLFAAQRDGLIPVAKARDESLDVVQRVAQTSAAAAITKLGIRLAVGTDRLAQLIREDQDLASEAEASDKAIIAAVSKEPSQRDSAVEQRIQERLVAIARARDALQKTLAGEFPEYAALSNPLPATAEQVQALLSDEEALLLFAAANDQQSYVFAFTHKGVDWKSIPLGGDLLAQKVAQFRRGLDPVSAKAAWFDLGLAHQLYISLLGPVQNLIKDKRQLIVVPFGPLTALPFHLLVSEKALPLTQPVQDTITAENMAPYRNAAWLIKRQAVSVMPSLASLTVLRRFARKGEGLKPVIGFGDPVFNAAAARSAAQRGTNTTVARNLVTRAYTDVWHGAGVDRKMLNQALPQLPDTADELKAVARNLGASLDDIHLGLDATEAAVKRAPLANYRIVYFATHGLVSGEIRGLAEPSLALTLPAQASDLDDGLLTASEVAQLKLNADWVVLSACNTIAGDKPGAEALSGLARAFFYAGARSLLVSHWSVASDAAARLTTATFDILKADSTLGRAEAMRRAMLDYLNDSSEPSNAYPTIWGPFSIIGEGAAR